MKIIYGNAMDMDRLLEPDDRFDAVITDPPYASGSGTLSGVQAQTSRKYTSTKARCPYPDFDGDNTSLRAWQNMLRVVLTSARARCVPGAVIALCIDWRNLAALSDAMEWAGWTWRGIAVWDKGGGCRPQKGRFRAQAEYILWGSNGAMPMNRPVGVLPGVMRAPNVSVGRIHQTQKPLELMRQVVQLCVPDGRILDPFCGGGTTLLAAKLEGREAVGFESCRAIYEAAKERLEKG